MLSVQIPEGDVDRCLRACIVDKGSLYILEECFKLFYVPPDQLRCNMVLDGARDGAGRVSGDHAGRRSLPEAGLARIGENLNYDILDRADAAQSGFERNPQRNRKDGQPDIPDLHI